MPTPTKGPRLGGGPAHEKLIISNLARALFSEGRIRTTEAKAKRLRPQAERLITFAKRGDVASRRQVLTVVRDKAVVHTLFAEIAPRFADRQGGYTRILKLGPRPGAGAAGAWAAAPAPRPPPRAPTGPSAAPPCAAAAPPPARPRPPWPARTWTRPPTSSTRSARPSPPTPRSRPASPPPATRTRTRWRPRRPTRTRTRTASRRRGEGGGVEVPQPPRASDPADGVRRLRLVVAYDGGPFSGFARQRDRHTVQGELEAALERLAKRPVVTVGAGRTDAGVHARGQVVHADVPAGLEPERVRRALNGGVGPA